MHSLMCSAARTIETSKTHRHALVHHGPAHLTDGRQVAARLIEWGDVRHATSRRMWRTTFEAIAFVQPTFGLVGFLLI